MVYLEKEQNVTVSHKISPPVFASSIIRRAPLSLFLFLLFIVSCQADLPTVAPDLGETPASDSRTLGTSPDMTPLSPDTIPSDASITTIPAVKPDRSSDSCGQLDDPLRQLSEADDPELFAQQHGLWLTPEGVGVEIRLTSAEATPDLIAYQIELRGQRAAIMEAFVPIAQLCNLAEDEEVMRIVPLRPLQMP